MEINYDDYTDLQLVQLWKEKWTGSETSFCRTFCVNQGNFSGYVKGKRASNQSRIAIIKLLHESGDVDRTITWKNVIECCNMSLPSYITRVIWIDGDNSSYALEHLKNNPIVDAHVFFIYLKGRYSRYTRGFSDQENFTFVHSISHVKDSADIAITLLATQLNTKISNDVQYTFVSKDHFVRDLFVYFSQYRECKVITSVEEF